MSGDRLERKAIRVASEKIADAIDAHTKVIQSLLDYLNPAAVEAKMGSAEADEIDDSAGVYQLDEQTRQQLKDKWVQLGYPPELIKHI